MSKSQKFVVWNSIDNITTHPGAFSTKKNAENFKEESSMVGHHGGTTDIEVEIPLLLA